MAGGIQAALTALGAKGTGARWSLDLATLDLSSVFGGALMGEAAIDVTSEEALAFAKPPELAALGSLWVPGLQTGEALAVAICEAHESLRVRLDNDLETLARLGIDARLAAPVARARGTMQVGDDDVAVEIDPSGELVVTHVGAAKVAAGQGRALGAPEDTEAEEALVRITRVVLRVRERNMFEAASDEEHGIDVDVDMADDESAAPAGGGAWSEDEHTQAVGDTSAHPSTQNLSDEQLAAVHEALSEESASGEAPDMSDEAEPILDPDDEPVETAPVPMRSTASDAVPLPQPVVADDEDDIRTVSISLRQQSSLLRALDALGGPVAAPADDPAADPAEEQPATMGLPLVPSTGHSAEPTDGTEGDGADIDGDADRTVSLAAPPPVSMASMPELPAGSVDRGAQPTVVLSPPARPSGEDAAEMPPPTGAVAPVSARIPSDEIESIARGFDEGDDIDEGAVAPVPADDDAGDDTAGFHFDRPPVVPTLDDAPPATNATVSQPAEPAAPGPSMEEPSEEEPLAADAPAGATPGADPPAAVVDSLALLPPDDAAPPNTLAAADDDEGADDDSGAAVERAAAEAEPGPLFAPADDGALEPAETASINLPESMPGTVDARPPVPSVAAPPIIDDDDDDEPKTRPFHPSDLLGLLKRTTDRDDAEVDAAALEQRAAALEAEARELRMRAGALRARQAAVTVVPPGGAGFEPPSVFDDDDEPLPPPPLLSPVESQSGSSLPSLPSMEVQAIEASSGEPEPTDERVTPPPQAAPAARNSAEEGVSLADVRAALGAVAGAGDSTQVGVVEVQPELKAPFPSAESDVFADATAALPSPSDAAATSVRRSIVLVVEDARARDRLKRHLLPRYDELFEAPDASSAVELPNLARLDALVFVRPRPDAKTRHGLSHLEGMSRRPRVLVISSDDAFDEMPSVDHRLPLGNRASEVAQQVIDGLTALGVTPLEA
ncbi:MAG: hypothetical protein HYS27_26985 [Deltaproteobacteria bacterium]|nr:hypothetical protein [Deltaproteobacteria bacterium]